MFVGGSERSVNKNYRIPSQLNELLSYARVNVSAYKDYPAPISLNTIEDFQKLPLINERQLTKAPESFKSDSANIYRISSSSGTTGFPKTLYRTYEDHLFSSKVAAEMFKTSTIGSSDTVAILHPFDVWGIAFVALEALRFLNATALPIGSVLDDEKCIKWFSQFLPSVVYSTPSRACSIADLVSEYNLEDRNWSPRAFLLAGEPVTNDIRLKLKSIFNAEVFSIYGSEETDGLAAECFFHDGLHLVETGLFYELIDPETLSPTYSNSGILAVTPLGWRGTILLRYILNDIVELDFTQCKCGNPGPRIVNVKRHTKGYYLWDALYITEGQIEGAIEQVFGKLRSYQCIVKATKPPQVLEILIDLSKKMTSFDNTINEIRKSILNSNLNLAEAYDNGEVVVHVKHTTENKFKKTQRGKVPKFIQQGNNS